MANSIRTVVVLGASGTIGGLIGGLIAQSGIKVYFLSRTLAGAKRGLERAISQARSEVISRNIVCGDYDTLLGNALGEADWIIECVSEDLTIKQGMYEKVDQYRKPDAIVSSMTSSLPLSSLPEGRSENFRKNFLSTHFYNPPAKMLACEITGTPDTSPKILKFMVDFLKTKLHQVVIPVRNTAGFAGNRIAFMLFNRVTTLAAEYGVEMMDYLIGPYTGRLMPPLATLDLVGVDIYKAIIENLYEYTNDEMHNSFILPDYINKMICSGALGNKTPDNGGFHRKDTSGNCLYFNPNTLDYVPAKKPHIEFVEAAEYMIHWGKYREAFDIVKTSRSKETDIVTDILCAYIAYSYARIGEVTREEFGIDGIDKVMSFGYHWAPPSLIVNMFGGKKYVLDLLEKKGFEVPDSLTKASESACQVSNAGKYFLSR